MYEIKDYTETAEPQTYSAERFDKRIVERQIYVVNLSKARIAVLVVTALLLVGFAFGAGIIIGNTATPSAQSGEAANSTQTLSQNTEPAVPLPDSNEPIPELDEPASSENAENNVVEAITIPVATPEFNDTLKKTDEEIEQNLAKDLALPHAAPKYEAPAVQEEAPRTPAVTTPYAPKKRIYFIQVAYSYDKERTEKERARLKKRFPRTFVKEDIDNGKRVYKLKIGRFNSQEEAEAALEKVRDIPAYRDSYIYTDTAGSRG